MKVFGLLLVLLTIQGCVKASDPLSTVKSPNTSPACLASEFPEFLSYGDVKSILWLNNLKDCERRALLIQSEGAAVSTGALATRQYALRLIKMDLPYIEVPREEVNLRGIESHEGENGPMFEVESPERLAQMSLDLGVEITSQSVKIPIHPTTRNQHPLIQRLIVKGYTVGSGPSVIGTMSRSVWFQPGTHANTIKLGSDFINGRISPNKLTDVNNDIVDLQDLMTNTSIPDFMAKLDVEYLTDSKALTITKKNAPGGVELSPYGISLRDYSRLLQDKHRVYIPLALLQDRGRKSEGCEGEYMVPYGFNRYIKIPEQKVTEMLYQLNQVLGRVIAIHHANGYMPIDFHEQNLLVGIPINPQVPARLVIRDVADIYPFEFEKTQGRTWAGVVQVRAKGVRYPDVDLVQAVAYKDQMVKMGFFKGHGDLWDRVPQQLGVKDIARRYYESNQSTFWAEVSKFRQLKCSRLGQSRSNIVTQCFRRATTFRNTSALPVRALAN